MGDGTVEAHHEDPGTDEWAIPDGSRGDEDDLSERARTAADRAAQDAELRATEEIAALERDLEESRTRTQRAESRAQALARELAMADSRARETAGEGGRDEGAGLRAEREARERIEGENRELRRRLERAERAREQARGTAPDHDPEAIEAEAAERVARIEADADERLRSEVGVARRAAEERFAERLAERERDVEREREMRVEAVEAADRRLSRIETRLLEAVERLEEAERALAGEAEATTPDRGDRVEERDDTAGWAVVPENAHPSEPDDDSIGTGDDRISVTRAGPDELRSAGLSASQARRVIRYRDEHRLNSVAGLEEVPGFSRELLDRLAGRLRD